MVESTTSPRIAMAAIRTAAGEVYSLPRPARHHNVIHHMHGLRVPQSVINAGTQGFVLDTGQFVMRLPALGIAYRAKQLVRQPATPHHGLFSEDVW